MDYLSKSETNKYAQKIAVDYAWVWYNQSFYMPVDFETLDPTTPPAPERTIWIPRDEADVQEFVNHQFHGLFETEKKLVDFCYQIAQYATKHKATPSSLLVVTDDGLRELNRKGELVEPTGKFIPNTVPVKLNTDTTVKAELFDIISNWVDSEDEAHALLRHLSVMLAPHWQSIKYLLFLGAGRNGKSVLLEMLVRLIGRHNCSQVSRQDIAAASTVVTQLNNKLANIVFDGTAEYLKDSGLEKTLIAGEQAGIRKLYSRTLTPVQTNALFIEALNQEPITKDKSTALQARLVRFEFPNRFTDDPAFKARMFSEEYVGALLSLLIDHYVKEEDQALMLAPTSKQIELKQGHVLHNSLAMQYLVELVETVPEGANLLLDKADKELCDMFKSWRVREGDISPWSDQSILVQFRPLVKFGERKSRRIGDRIVKVRTVEAFHPDTQTFLNNLETSDDGAAIQSPLVED